MKYEYLIAYAYDSGFGSAYVTLEQKIDRHELLLEIAEEIAQDNNFNNQVVILNFLEITANIKKDKNETSSTSNI